MKGEREKCTLPQSQADSRVTSSTKYGKVAPKKHADVSNVPLYIEVEWLGRLKEGERERGSEGGREGGKERWRKGGGEREERKR